MDTRKVEQFEELDFNFSYYRDMIKLRQEEIAVREYIKIRTTP